MRKLLCLALLVIATPAFGAGVNTGAESLVKKVPNSKTRSVVVGKTPVFNLPEEAKSAVRKEAGVKRAEPKGTLLNDYKKKKDGWGNTLKTPKEEADAFLNHNASPRVKR